ELVLLDGFERLARAAHRARRVALAGEPLAERVAHDQLVVDDQDATLCLRRRRCIHYRCHRFSCRPQALPAPAFENAPAAASCRSTGSRTVNSAPSPGAERTEISPACCSTMLCATARPRPVRF